MKNETKEKETQERGTSALTRLLGGRKITDSTKFEVPESIATCVDCDSKLTVEVDGWSIEKEGVDIWLADSVTPWCDRWEQCVHEQSFADYADGIRNSKRIIGWLNKQYRWQFEAT